MIRLFAGLMIFGTAIASACSCAPQTVEQSKAQADVVFRGKIVEFRESVELGRIAVFRVDRVWKGSVSKTIEMLTAEGLCFGFGRDMVRIGAELLVYGSGSKDLYVPDVCSRTAFARGNPDIDELGKGTPPK
jgi:hypothetical protein